MTNRDKLLLSILRTVFMVAIGLFFLTLPFRLPDNNIGNWIGNSVLVIPGLMILYVEGWLWYHRWKLYSRRGDTASTNESS